VTALSIAAAALALAGWLRFAWLGVEGRRAMIPLGPPRPGPVPRVTAIVPCRDEAAGVERALRSLLAQVEVEGATRTRAAAATCASRSRSSTT